MKSLPLIIFSILSFLGILSYNIPFNQTHSNKQPDPVKIFIKHPGKSVVQFNSTWNKKNEYKWIPIKGVRYKEIDIDNYPHYRKIYGLHSLPTIIVFNKGKEIDRYEANIMLKLDIKQQELQLKLK